MNDWLKDSVYIVMDCRHPTPGYEKEYKAAYECWKKAWTKFRADIGITEPLHSDGFLLCDEMGVIFYKGECVGLSGFSYGDLSDLTVQDNSWFSAWSSEAYAKLSAISDKNGISSQFTVSPDFAGKNQVVRWKEMLVLFGQMRFIYSDIDTLSGHLNLTKGMQNAAGEEFGATVIDPLHVHDFHGVPLNAQLIAYQKENLWKMIERKNLGELVTELTAKTIHISSFAYHKPKQTLKIAA